MAGKAQEFAKEHPEQVEGAGEKAGEFGKERFAGHDEQIDQVSTSSRTGCPVARATRAGRPPSRRPDPPTIQITALRLRP